MEKRSAQCSFSQRFWPAREAAGLFGTAWAGWRQSCLGPMQQYKGERGIAIGWWSLVSFRAGATSEPLPLAVATLCKFSELLILRSVELGRPSFTFFHYKLG